MNNISSIPSISEMIFGMPFVLFLVFLVLLSILWFVLPFAVFGVKKRLDTLIGESRKINLELKILNSKNREN